MLHSLILLANTYFEPIFCQELHYGNVYIVVNEKPSTLREIKTKAEISATFFTR